MNFRPSGAARALATMIAVSGLLFVHAAQAQSNPNIVIAQNTQAAPRRSPRPMGAMPIRGCVTGTAFMSGSAPYTEHFRNNPEYAKHTYLVDLGIQSQYDKVWGSDATLFGLAIFQELVRPAVAVHLLGPAVGHQTLAVCQGHGRSAAWLQGQVQDQHPIQRSWRGAGDHPVGGIALWQLPR